MATTICLRRRSLLLLAVFFITNGAYLYSQEDIPADRIRSDALQRYAEIEKWISDTPVSVKKTPQEPGELPDEVKPLLDWSKPVNGLVGRVEFVSRGYSLDLVILVRLKNVSQYPLLVPISNPTDPKLPQPFYLYFEDARGAALAPLFSRKDMDNVLSRTSRYQKILPAQASDLLPILLQPGESALVGLYGRYLGKTSNPDRRNEIIIDPTKLKIYVKQNNVRDKGAWDGTLIIPLIPFTTESQQKAMKGVLPFPNYFPAFSSIPYHNLNGSPFDPIIKNIYASNSELIDALDLYEEDGVRRYLEERMVQERQTTPIDMLCATLAAARGSREGALFFPKLCKTTDCGMLSNMDFALNSVLLPELKGKNRATPDWLGTLSIALFQDRRPLTGESPSHLSSDKQYVYEIFGSEMIFQLAELKNERAIVFLKEAIDGKVYSPQIDELFTIAAIAQLKDKSEINITRLKNYATSPGKDDNELRQVHAIEVLYQWGDSEAVSLLNDLLKRKKHWETDGSTENELTWLIIEKKIVEAGPLLLKFVEDTSVMRIFEELNDRRAIPILKEIVQREGKSSDPEQNEERPDLILKRLLYANLTLAALKDADAVQQLCKMLEDTAWNEAERELIVEYLGISGDRSVIPFLIKEVKVNPDGLTASEAVSALSHFKVKKVVEALLEFFQDEFIKDYKRTKNPYTQMKFHQDIASSLKEITGEDFGPDPDKWRQWWEEKGKNSPDLK